jgi:hypothetical protein
VGEFCDFCNAFDMKAAWYSLIVYSAGLEIPAHKLAKLPIRSRLNHIKHLARSLADTLDIGDSHKITGDLTMTGYATSNCKL